MGRGTASAVGHGLCSGREESEEGWMGNGEPVSPRKEALRELDGNNRETFNKNASGQGYIL